MRTPNFFIVGASKAGTTSLAQALGEHPDIFMSHPKEPNFFNRFSDFNEIDEESMKEYLQLFDLVQNEEIVGEASVRYLSSGTAAKNIHRFNQNAKIVISLRNPLERIVSMYEMYVRHGLNQSFHYAIKEDPWLVRQNLYSPSIELFLDVFAEDNLHIIDFKDLRDDWSETMMAIFDFLSVRRIKAHSATKRNTGGIPASPAFRILSNRRLVKFGKIIIPNRWHESIDLKIKRTAFKKLEVPDDLYDELKHCFSQDALKMDSLLGSDFRNRWFGSKP